VYHIDFIDIFFFYFRQSMMCIREKQHQALCKKVRSVVGHFKHSIRANNSLKIEFLPICLYKMYALDRIAHS